MHNIFGQSHFVSRDIRGSNVVSVEIDQQNSHNVIITSKENVKLYEPEGRTIHRSWAGKSWLTPSGGCVNNAKGEFFCLVDGNKLLQWTGDNDELDIIKPVKFTSKVERLHPYNGSVYVVFSSGAVEEVTAALTHHKEIKPDLVPEGDSIRDVVITGDNVILATSSKGSHDLTAPRLHYFPLDCSSRDDVTSYEVRRPDLTLMGLGLTSRSTAVTLWSNGDLCSGVVGATPPELMSESRITSLLMAVKGSCRDRLHTSKPVSIVQVSPRHIAFVGQHASEDGGRVSLWDLDLFVEVCRRGFKLYQPRMRCWVGGRALLLHEQQQITVIPLQKLPPQGLQQLFTEPVSMVITEDEPVIRSDWSTKGSGPGLPNGITNETSFSKGRPVGKSPAKKKSSKKKSINSREDMDTLIDRLKLKTLDDALCNEVLINHAVSRRDVLLVCEIVSRNHELPEHGVVDLLAFVLAADDASFDCLVDSCSLCPTVKTLEQAARAAKSKRPPSSVSRKGSKQSRLPMFPSFLAQAPGKNGSRHNLVNGGSGADGAEKVQQGLLENEGEEDGALESSGAKASNSILNGPRVLLINRLLCLPVVDALLGQELRRLPFRDATTLVRHINHMLRFNLHRVAEEMQCDFGVGVPAVSVVPSRSNACTWLSCLSDAHFQLFMLDQKLNNARFATKKSMAFMNKLAQVVAESVTTDHFLSSLLSDDDKPIVKSDSNDSDGLYTVERITITV